MFFKSFLEFDGANMVSILSFDSRSMSSLLSESNSRFFTEEYPLIYKNKIFKRKEKYFFRNAIDRALKANQIRAVSVMIDYIVKFQNSYVSSYLFNKNLPELLEKGIRVSHLFESQIFCYTFDLEEWPSSHMNKDHVMKPYNNSLFDLRQHYQSVFPEFEKIDQNIEVDFGTIDTSKIYKI